MAFLKRPVVHLAFIFAFGLLTYSNTFKVPFHWDDTHFILQNPVVKDLSYFGNPSSAKGSEFYGALKNRYIGYLTFALNYKLHGFNVAGYHVFNLAVHIANALLVYALVRLTFGTPLFNPPPIDRVPNAEGAALFSALLFVSHPVQTEAVTYIFQRLASLAAMFYLLSLVLYIKWRGSQTPFYKGYTALYVLSLLCALFAMKTKENALTLPLMIGLYEFIFFKGAVKDRSIRLVPFFLIAVVMLHPLADMGATGVAIGPASSHGFSRVDYLNTEFRVIATYIRLLFYPVGQNADYDYPVYMSLFEPQVLLSFMLILSILASAMFMLLRSGATAGLKLTAFGIFWFFLSLSVESGVVPLPTLINEYRVYLPSAGAFIALSAGLFLLTDKLKDKRVRALILAPFIAMPLLFSHAAYKRNSVWQSEVSLWEDVVKKSPGKSRGHYNLALASMLKGRYDEAIVSYERAFRLSAAASEDWGGKGAGYIRAYRADIFAGLGAVYMAKGQTDKGIAYYESALGLMPDYNEKARVALGIAYASMGQAGKAIEHLRIAARRISTDDPDYTRTHYNLGVACYSEGLMDEAVEHYELAVKQSPGDVKARLNLGAAYAAMGRVEPAIEHFEAAVGISPGHADAHFNLGLAYLRGGLADRAAVEFDKALKIRPDFPMARQYLGHIDKVSGH